MVFDNYNNSNLSISMPPFPDMDRPVVVSDKGTQFTVNEFAQFCIDFNIIHLRSPPGPLQSNDLAECMVNTLKRPLQVSSQMETK